MNRFKCVKYCKMVSGQLQGLQVMKLTEWKMMVLWLKVMERMSFLLDEGKIAAILHFVSELIRRPVSLLQSDPLTVT